MTGFRPADLGAGYTRERYRPNGTAQPHPSEAPAPPLPIETLSAADLAGTHAPPRDFHVRDLVPARTVTLLGGDGGTGKSLAALQLSTATVLGSTWLGLPVVTGPVVFVTAEDDRDEVHRRLEDITNYDGQSLAELKDLHLIIWAGQDALLAVTNKNSSALVQTDKFKALDATVADLKPVLVVLDTLADLFGGVENDRAQARQFIQMLRGLALRRNTTVLLLSHPSLSGISSGSGTSGSTAWSNSVRSRLYLDRVRDETGAEANTDLRVLRVMKANYAPKGGEHELRWQAGVFVPTAPPAGLRGFTAQGVKDRAEQVFMSLVEAYDAENRKVSSTPSANYAPSIFARDSRSQGVAKRALTDAMNRLFAAKRIEVIEIGPPSKRRTTIKKCNSEVVN